MDTMVSTMDNNKKKHSSLNICTKKYITHTDEQYNTHAILLFLGPKGIIFSAACALSFCLQNNLKTFRHMLMKF